MSEYTIRRTKRILKSNETPRWEYITRFDVKVQVLQDDEGNVTITVRDTFRILLDILDKTGDSTTVIIPLKETDEVKSKPIIDNKDPSTNISQLKKYFGGDLR